MPGGKESTMKTSATFLIATFFLGLAACGGGDDAPAPTPPPPPPPAGTVIGPAGGTVTGPSGTSVLIPAGALASDTRILIEVVTAGAPPTPNGFTAGGQMFSFTPHGTTFAVPVTMTIPFDPAQVPAGQQPAFFKTNAQNQWEQITNATFGATSASAQVTGFSLTAVFVQTLTPAAPVYTWDVIELKGRDLEEQVYALGSAISQGVAAHYDFGFAHRDADVFSFNHTLVTPSDGLATAQIAGTADGVDWWVGTEAPLSRSGDPTQTLGTVAVYRQSQAFIKNTPDARLSFFLKKAFLQTSDANGTLNRRCPAEQTVGLRCEAISAQLILDASALAVPSDMAKDAVMFYRLAGDAELTGIAGSWDSQAHTSALSSVKLWDNEDFRFTIENIDEHEEALVTMELSSFPSFHEYFVDLSSIDVGQAVVLTVEATAKAYNRAALPINHTGAEFETSARAFMRDPRAPLGLGVSFSGLEPIDVPDPLVLPPAVPVTPKPCVPGPGPDPAAGTLQFDAPDYLQLESNVSPAVIVTRTGGTTGAVTATFSTSDGNAVAAVDYTALATTVFFADGDDSPRLLPVKAIPDTTSGEPDKTVNLTLSQPGGCAALGAQTTAVLTIRDDDPPPPPPGFTVGGTVTGLVGTGLTLQDQHFTSITPGNGPFTFNLPTQTGSHYEVTITSQPSNPVQVCSIANGSGIMGNANVTIVGVNCSAPPPPGGLDPGFGGGTGKVSTAFGGDETDMLLQGDGKIIMIGGSPSSFVMARYKTDGSLDETFGTGGLVTTDVGSGLDVAYGGALLADGRILVVGSARVGSSDDFAIVRYLPNGTVDTTFGTQGKTTTDFLGQRDRAFAVAVQPDNRIVVVGDAIVTFGNSDFAVARYDANGVLDTSFDGDGKVTTDIELHVDIAKNVVIESGGTILVTGAITIGNSAALEHTGLVRYTAGGAPDPSFGTDGILSMQFMQLGEGLVLQPDGRIIVAGTVEVAGQNVFGVMRLGTNGFPDNSFGSLGLATVAFSTAADVARDVTLDAQGRILLSGQSSIQSTNADFAVARFTSAGLLDASFDDDGRFFADFFNASDGAENIAVQPDGKIVLGGFAANGTVFQYALVRVNP